VEKVSIKLQNFLKKNQEFLKEKSSPPCETPSQDQEATESQEYYLSLSSLLGQK
jgi:hypothetical protein